MTISSHGAENVHSQVWQRFCSQATQWAIFSGPPVLLTSSSMKTFPLVASSQIYSYTVTIFGLIWNYILFYQRLSHTFGNVKNSNFAKIGEIQIT